MLWPGGVIPFAFWGGGTVQLDGRHDLSVVQGAAGETRRASNNPCVCLRADTVTHGNGAELLMDSTAQEQQLAIEAMRQVRNALHRSCARAVSHDLALCVNSVVLLGRSGKPRSVCDDCHSSSAR